MTGVRRFHTPPFLILGFGAALMVSHPLQRVALTVFKSPLLLTRAVVVTIGKLPEVPRLEQENGDLRTQLSLQQLELVRLREAVRRMSRLEELTRVFTNQPSIIVSIIGRTIAPDDHMVILDRGVRDGVLANAVLLDARGLVGRVIESMPTTSSAMLLTDPDSRIACVVERSRELGLLVGTGGASCQLIHLDVEADVEVGDLVVTAGLDGPFPKGLIVGTISKIVREREDATASAWVRPSVNLRQVEEMRCLLPSRSSSPAP